eukprot:2225012-Pleurochrysis_carterae.AAC.3
MQHKFTAWLKRSKTAKTQLVLEYKVVVMHETSAVDLPPNCHYPDAEQRRKKAIAVEALMKLMAYQDYPLSSGLLALAGITSGAGAARAQRHEILETQRKASAASTASSSAAQTAKKRPRSAAAAEEKWTSGDKEEDESESRSGAS